MAFRKLCAVATYTQLRDIRTGISLRYSPCYRFSYGQDTKERVVTDTTKHGSGRFCLALSTISLATYSAVLLYKWEQLGTGRGEQNVLATKGCTKRENGASF